MKHLLKGLRHSLFGMTHHVVQRAESIFNPHIGEHLVRHQRPGYLVHLSAHSVQTIHERGFPARVSPQELLQVSRQRLEDYQSYNSNKFGMGACSSYPELAEGFIAGNPSLAKERVLYGFYAPSLNIGEFRAHHLGESNERDYEREHLVLEDVPSDAILVATGPEYRKKFEDGLLVPNEIAEFDTRLPKSFRIRDVENLPSILTWLLAHNSIESACALCQSVFVESSEQSIRFHLKDEKPLIDFVNSALPPKLSK
jgi:hypothetical protein